MRLASHFVIYTGSLVSKPWGEKNMSESQLLFVYGSFTTGMIHNNAIEKYIVEREPAQIMAYASRMPVGYPTITLEAPKYAKGTEPTMVSGELLKLEAPDVVLRVLDEFHGVSVLVPEKSLHFKKEVPVLVGERTLTAQAYVMNPAKLPKGSEIIVDGNWKKCLSEKPSIIAYLNERHISYMRKLGQTSGRQVIPYDLNLSRELMKLELIVDKGRRLALTKLGKEALRYLPE